MNRLINEGIVSPSSSEQSVTRLARFFRKFTLSGVFDVTESQDELEHPFNDPLAVDMPLLAGADDLPSYGWPKEVDPVLLGQILDWLPDDD